MMGCGGSVPVEVIEDPREGETLEALKDLWLWDSPAAKKPYLRIESIFYFLLTPQEALPPLELCGFRGVLDISLLWLPGPIFTIHLANVLC